MLSLLLEQKHQKFWFTLQKKGLAYVFLNKNTNLKNFRLSCTVPTLDTYFIADTKSVKGTKYNSV